MRWCKRCVGEYGLDLFGLFTSVLPGSRTVQLCWNMCQCLVTQPFLETESQLKVVASARTFMNPSSLSAVVILRTCIQI